MREPRTTQPAEDSLFSPRVQLEKLPMGCEGPYQRAIRFLGRCMLPGLALFCATMLLEGATGALSRTAAATWLALIHRPPSAFGGQGSLGLRSLLWMVRLQAEKGPIRMLFAGDSVFAPSLGGDTGNEVAVDSIAAARIPGALNLSQEGVEWGMNSLFLQRLEQDPAIRRDRPLLVVDMNPKFFASDTSFTPAFPVEIPLCARRPDPTDPDMDFICERLQKDWPKGLAALSRLSPGLLETLQGQLDFLKTFALRAPIYRLYERPRGVHALRIFVPGWVDAASLKARYGVDPPLLGTPDYARHSDQVNAFERNVLTGATVSQQPKLRWLRSLARTLGRWPGPVLVLWWDLSPGAEAVLDPRIAQALVQLREAVGRFIGAVGKEDLKMARNRAFLTEADDFADSDHLTAKGHAKLARYVDEYARGIGK